MESLYQIDDEGEPGMRISKFTAPLFLLPLIFTAYSDLLPAAETGSIAGNVYCDHDKNGICDCEETGLKNIHVQIFAGHCGGNALQTVTTDEKGNFAFESFNPGTYFVSVDLDYVCGGRVPTTGNCQQVVLVNGENITLPAFGYSEYGQ